MRTVLIIFYLFSSIRCLAQNSAPVHRDTARTVIFFVDAKPIGKHEIFLYVIDNKPHYRSSIKRILDTSDLLDFQVLKGKKAMLKYGKTAGSGVVMITTKKYAVKAYQEKFSNLSIKYKEYLRLNHNKDDSVAYIVNGKFFDEKPNEVTLKLYKIPSDQIKTVDIIENTFRNGNPQKELVIVTTKQ